MLGVCKHSGYSVCKAFIAVDSLQEQVQTLTQPAQQQIQRETGVHRTPSSVFGVFEKLSLL